MKVTSTDLPGVLVIDPRVFTDARGSFFESFHSERYHVEGVPTQFVQDNVSRSNRGVLRGLHVQFPHPQGKLILVLEGEIFDVAVDVRRGSPSFGRWTAMNLSSENIKQVYVPPGFAHGFVVTSDTALVCYKCTEYYHPEAELSLRWDDPEIGIDWPYAVPSLSARDRVALSLSAVPPECLPVYDVPVTP